MGFSEYQSGGQGLPVSLRVVKTPCGMKWLMPQAVTAFAACLRKAGLKVFQGVPSKAPAPMISVAAREPSNSATDSTSLKSWTRSGFRPRQSWPAMVSVRSIFMWSPTALTWGWIPSSQKWAVVDMPRFSCQSVTARNVSA